MRYGILARSWLVAGGLFAAAGLATGCDGSPVTPGTGGSGGGTNTGAGGTGGMPGTGGAGGASSTTTSEMTTTTTTTTTDTGPNPCDPTTIPGCPANGVPSACAAIVDNAGKDAFGLRMSHVDFQLPTKLAGGLAGPLIQDAVLWDLAACNFNGGGTFSLLLGFDKTAGTLKIGGAKPVVDPTAGYCYVNEIIGGTQVTPATIGMTIGMDGAIDTPTGGDLAIPVYVSSTTIILLPAHNVRLTNAKLSADQSCVGAFNLAGANAGNNCEPSPPFLTDGALDGYITLEEADSIVVAPLGQSLCAFLTGENDGGTPALCPKDPMTMQITAMGDWCSVTDSAGGCADAMKLIANLAASGVLINGDCP